MLGFNSTPTPAAHKAVVHAVDRTLDRKKKSLQPNSYHLQIYARPASEILSRTNRQHTSHNNYVPARSPVQWTSVYLVSCSWRVRPIHHLSTEPWQARFQNLGPLPLPKNPAGDAPRKWSAPTHKAPPSILLVWCVSCKGPELILSF